MDPTERIFEYPLFFAFRGKNKTYFTNRNKGVIMALVIMEWRLAY